MPAPKTKKPASSRTKIELIILQLQQPEGASLAELAKLSGWREPSVRAALARDLPRRRGVSFTSNLVDGVRRYQLAEEAR
jgi:Protein of unknown function (DUF3489)